MRRAAQLVRIEHGKANAIDGEFLDTLSRELDRALTQDRSSVVLTGFDGFFSAGLNLETLPETADEMAAFVDRFEATFEKVLCFPLPLVAAVNGHAIAGGCVLAAACDLRIGAEGTYGVGVSEVSLGIVFPATAFEIMRQAVTPSSVPEVLLGGRLLSPREARSAGILHELVAAETLIQRAIAAAEELGTKPRRAFQHSKLALRAPMLERIERTREQARRGFLESWFSPEVVERRKAILSR